MKIFLILSILLLFIFNNAYIDSKKSTKDKLISTKVKIEYDKVKLFTKYHLDFPYITNREIMNNNNNNICLLNEYNDNNINSSNLYFMKHIDRCIRIEYFPRILNVNQISWKNTKDKNETNINNDDDNILNNNTNSSIINSNNNTIIKKSTAHEIIHEYLAFALLLPDHPFSNDLYQSLTVISPMFPNVNIVVGNGYEFSDMCVQYSIKSFPKLLFFKKGLLIGRYNNNQNAYELSAQFSKWSQSFPKALPYYRNKVLKPIKKNNNNNNNNNNNTDNNINKLINLIEKSKTINLLDDIKIILVKFNCKTIYNIYEDIIIIIELNKETLKSNIKDLWKLYESKIPVATEPVVGTFDYLIEHDSNIIFISFLYFIIRMLMFILGYK
jgi:hypothetical protein